MQKVNTEDSFQGKKHTIEIHIEMWRYKYKKNKAKQADIIKLAGQSESLAGLYDLGSNLPRLTTWVGRVLLYPAIDNSIPSSLGDPTVNFPSSRALTKVLFPSSIATLPLICPYFLASHQPPTKKHTCLKTYEKGHYIHRFREFR